MRQGAQADGTWSWIQHVVIELYCASERRFSDSSLVGADFVRSPVLEKKTCRSWRLWCRKINTSGDDFDAGALPGEVLELTRTDVSFENRDTAPAHLRINATL
jgi:hypothetical protein